MTVVRQARNLSGNKKQKKKVGSDFEWRVYGVSNAKMLEVIRVLGTFRYLRRILLTNTDTDKS